MKPEAPSSDEFSAGIAALEPYIRTVLSSYLQPREVSDVTQEVISLALDRREQLKSRSKLRSWIRSIARNCGVDRMRQRDQEAYLRLPETESAAPDEYDPSIALVNREVQVAFWRLIGTLQDQDLMLVAMRAAGVPYAVIEEVVGSPRGTLTSRLLRLRRSLFGE